MQFTAEQMEAAVAKATAGMDEAIVTARAEAAAAERERIKAVIGLPAAALRQKQAMAVAMAGATVEMAEALLSAAPTEAASALPLDRAANAPGGLVIDASSAAGPAGKDAGRVWQDAVAKINAKTATQREMMR